MAEVKKEISKHSLSPYSLITEKDIAPLPAAVQRYFRVCGYLGQEKMVNARVKWEEVYLKMSPDREWTRIDCDQFNFVPEPSRVVYMKSRIAGVLPFEGRDKYQDGQGNMRVELLKMLRVTDAKGKEMDESALVTILAEAVLIPSYALQDYVRWTPIDMYSAQATIHHNGLKVSGVFFFNKQGECIRFETADRHYAHKDGTYKKMKWSAEITGYTETNGVKIPAGMKATWHTPGGDYVYFKGKIGAVEFNIGAYSRALQST